MAGDEDGTGADLVEGGERTPRESSSSSSDIPAQDIKKEEDTRRADNGLSEAWHKYKQFESYRYSLSFCSCYTGTAC
jgi:hypothetical protein